MSSMTSQVHLAGGLGRNSCREARGSVKVFCGVAVLRYLDRYVDMVIWVVLCSAAHGQARLPELSVATCVL